jgi:HK97 family phage prohead protease
MSDFEIKTMEVPFEIKEVLEDGTFTGYASTFGGAPDSGGDVVARGAFTETIQKGGYNGTGIAMLWQHDPKQPIGTWPSIIENNKGLKVTGKLTLGVQQANEAHLLMKDKAIQGLSIGYKTLDYDYDKRRNVRTLKKLELREISPVTFPMNTRATITAVKSIIEEATNERELEEALRELMSKSAAQHIVSLCKDKLFDNLRESDDEVGSKEVEDLKGGDEDNPSEEPKPEVNYSELLNLISEQLRESGKKIVTEEMKKVIPFKKYPLAPLNAKWNGSKEVREADIDDLKSISTWFDASNPDVKASYKLPHHRASNKSTVWRGVAAAMAALLGARGGVQIPTNEKRGVYNHLKSHYLEFEKEVPDFKDYTKLELKKLFPEVFKI